jgi:hypothetical protein
LVDFDCLRQIANGFFSIDAFFQQSLRCLGGRGSRR